MIRDEYGRETIENRLGKEIFAPGDKVMIDLEKFGKDPDYDKMKPEYKEFAKAHANEIFTLAERATQRGPYWLVHFVEDETSLPWLWFIGHLKKVG